MLIIDLRKGLGTHKNFILTQFPDKSFKFFLNPWDLIVLEEIKIITTLRDHSDLFLICLVKDFFDREYPRAKIYLDITYLMYQQDDRVFANNESFGLKTLSKFINTLNFYSVCVYKPHSDMVYLIDRVIVRTDYDFIESIRESDNLENSYWVIPDSGAYKNQMAQIEKFGHKNFIVANKTRNHETGEPCVRLFCNDLNGEDCFIVDDICLGGSTFTQLAIELKKKGAGKIYLLIYHGIFNKGLSHLFEHFEHIYTTNSICEYPINATDKLTILKLT